MMTKTPEDDNVKLVPATRDDAPLLGNLLQLYIHDMSEFELRFSIFGARCSWFCSRIKKHDKRKSKTEVRKSKMRQWPA